VLVEDMVLLVDEKSDVIGLVVDEELVVVDSFLS
jgi:hypothetical protein